MAENKVSFLKIELKAIGVDGTRLIFKTMDGPQELQCSSVDSVVNILNQYADRWTPIYRHGQQINPHYGDPEYTHGPPRRTFEVPKGRTSKGRWGRKR